MKIAKEIDYRGGEGGAYGSLGVVYFSLGDTQKAIGYHEEYLNIAIEIGDRGGEGGANGNLGSAYQSVGDYRKALEHYEKFLKIALGIGDQAGEGRAYQNIGNLYFSLEQFEDAVLYCFSTVDVFNSLRSLLKSEDDWKMNFHQPYETAYTALWMSLLRIGKVDEGSFAAEQGRAQTLPDNLLMQYKLPPSLSAPLIVAKETISRLFTELSTPNHFSRN